CTVTVLAQGVSDVDVEDPPDHMKVDFFTSFTSTNSEICGDPAPFIHEIQGSGLTSPANGNLRTIEGIVTAVYQGSGEYGGFNVQEEDADVDGDPATSEGIFVYAPDFLVAVGEKVRVKGTVNEYPSAAGGQPVVVATELEDVTK